MQVSHYWWYNSPFQFTNTLSLDYCASHFSGLPLCCLRNFQKMKKFWNTAARIILRVPETDHTTPLLHSQVSSFFCSLFCLVPQLPAFSTCLIFHVYTPTFSTLLKQSNSHIVKVVAYQDPSTWNLLFLKWDTKKSIVIFYSNFKFIYLFLLFKYSDILL